MAGKRPAWKIFPEVEYVIGQKASQSEIDAEERRSRDKWFKRLAIVAIIGIILGAFRSKQEVHVH